MSGSSGGLNALFHDGGGGGGGGGGGRTDPVAPTTIKPASDIDMSGGVPSSAAQNRPRTSLIGTITEGQRLVAPASGGAPSIVGGVQLGAPPPPSTASAASGHQPSMIAARTTSEMKKENEIKKRFGSTLFTHDMS